MSAPAWAWDETAVEVVELHPGDVWRRYDGQERHIEHLWPPEAMPALEGPLRGCVALCEWLDARMPFWEDALYLGTVAGMLSAVVGVMVR